MDKSLSGGPQWVLKYDPTGAEVDGSGVLVARLVADKNIYHSALMSIF